VRVRARMWVRELAPVVAGAIGVAVNACAQQRSWLAQQLEQH